jgi:hypothetical protein
MLVIAGSLRAIGTAAGTVGRPPPPWTSPTRALVPPSSPAERGGGVFGQSEERCSLMRWEGSWRVADTAPDEDDDGEDWDGSGALRDTLGAETGAAATCVAEDEDEDDEDEVDEEEAGVTEDEDDDADVADEDADATLAGATGLDGRSA